MAVDLSFPPEPERTDEQRAEVARREQVAALRRELAGYRTYGRTDRAAQVVAALEALGEQADAPEGKPAKRAVPKGRTRVVDPAVTPAPRT